MIKKAKAVVRGSIKAKYRGLTNRLKKSIIHGDGSWFSLNLLGRLRRFKGSPTSAPSTLTTFLFKPHKGWKDSIMKKLMTLRSLGGKNSGRFATAGSVLAVSLLLVACGGGGSSSSGGGVTPPPPAAPTISLTSVSPASGATDVAVDAKPVFTFAEANVTSLNSTTALSCNNKEVKYGVMVDLTSKPGVATMTFTPIVPFNNGDVCTMDSSLTASGAGGTAPVVKVVTSFTVVATAAWWPAPLRTMDTKVVGMGQPPASALLIADAAWQKATIAGLVKYIDSGIALDGYTIRPVVWAFYKGPVTGNSCTRLVYKDDGTAVGQNKTTEGDCNTGDPVDWVVGTSVGVIRHFAGATNKCYQYTWDKTRLGLVDNLVACPF